MQERTSSNLMTGQTSRQKIQEILLRTGDKVGLSVQNWRVPEKTPRKVANFLDFSEICAMGYSQLFLFVAEWRIFGKKNDLSELETQVSKVYRQTLLSNYLDSECAPGFRFSRKYFWELNGLSFMGIRSRKCGDQPQDDFAQSGYGPAMTCTKN